MQTRLSPMIYRNETKSTTTTIMFCIKIDLVSMHTVHLFDLLLHA